MIGSMWGAVGVCFFEIINQHELFPLEDTVAGWCTVYQVAPQVNPLSASRHWHFYSSHETFISPFVLMWFLHFSTNTYGWGLSHQGWLYYHIQGFALHERDTHKVFTLPQMTVCCAYATYQDSRFTLLSFTPKHKTSAVYNFVACSSQL